MDGLVCCSYLLKVVRPIVDKSFLSARFSGIHGRCLKGGGNMVSMVLIGFWL